MMWWKQCFKKIGEDSGGKHWTAQMNNKQTLQDPKVADLFNKIHVLRQHWDSQQSMEFEDASYEKMQASTRLEADCFEDAKGAHGVSPTTTYRSNSTRSMSSVASSNDRAEVAESPAGTEMNLDIEMTEEQRKELDGILADLHALKIHAPEPELCPYFFNWCHVSKNAIDNQCSL